MKYKVHGSLLKSAAIRVAMQESKYKHVVGNDVTECFILCKVVCGNICPMVTVHCTGFIVGQYYIKNTCNVASCDVACSVRGYNVYL